jgi:hypothetical protein
VCWDAQTTRARFNGVNFTMDLETLSNEWIAAESIELKAGKELHWSIEYVMNLSFEDKYEELWSFIKYTYPKLCSGKVSGIFSAAPLEDFLSGAGDKYFEEISFLARTDNRFKNLLKGVWQSEMSDEFWQKICKLSDVAKNES